jgi:kumamolisin
VSRPRRTLTLLAAALPALALAAGPAQARSSDARAGAIAPGTRLSLEVSLTPRDPAALAAFVRAVSDRTSPQYGHYLTVAQFAARYGAAPASIAAVTAYLRAQGLSVGAVTANRLTMSASGTAAQAERAFGVGIESRPAADGHTAYAATGVPRVPADLAGLVQSVAGLSDTAPRPTRSPDTARPAAVSVFTPAMIRDAYNLATDIADGYNGKGETVGLAEFTAYTASDIAKYDSSYSIAAPSPKVVKVDGGTTDTSGETEADLDIELTQALAPAAQVAVYEAPNTDAGEVALYSALVSADVPIISTSWAQPQSEDDDVNADHADFEEAAAQGESVYACSGAEAGSSPDYPAADPYVTAVGGTDLTLTSSYAWSKETADSGSGVGVTTWPKPSYQDAVDSGAYREVPDVAADAGTPFDIYSGGTLEAIGGVSASPLEWAAFTADYDTAAAALGKPAFGYADPFIYTVAESSVYKSVFHDITSGTGSGGAAGPGYDLATGWGSYNGGNFIADEL